jgi:hypothetical protein
VIPLALELAASPVVVEQRVEKLSDPEVTQSVQRVETPPNISVPAREELTPPVTVLNPILAPPPGLPQHTPGQYHTPQPPAVPPVPYVIPHNRDRRLRQNPRKKSNNAEKVENTTAAAETEFQHDLLQDMQYRRGCSNFAIANAAMNLTEDGKPLTRTSVMSNPQSANEYVQPTGRYR